MQSVIFKGPNEASVEAASSPEFGNGDVRIRVSRAGICGTDLHIYRNEYVSDYPLIPGHEFVGTVDAVGPGVTGFRPGDRVTADPNLACGQCDYCRRLMHNHCRNWQAVGVTRDGAFAELVVVPARVVYPVPDSLTDAEAAFIEPLACVVHGMNRLPVAAGDRALVFGVGPIGLLLVQALRHRGVAQLVAVDREVDRLKLAESFGATHTLRAGSGDDDPEKHLRRNWPDGFDIVVDATGIPAVIQQALSHLGPRGRFLQFGVAPKDATITLRPFDLFRYDLAIIGSFALSTTFSQAIEWLAADVIDVKPLVSHVAPLADFQNVFDAFAAGKTMKVHLVPQA